MDKNFATDNFIKHAITIGALEFIPEGRRLKSGRRSPYFFNSGLFTTASSLRTLAEAYAEVISNNPDIQATLPEVAYGPAYKGIPLATAVAMVYQNGGVLEYASTRKEIKDHGEGGKSLYASVAGKSVIIIDDVISSGISAEEAVKEIIEAGGIPVGLAVAFDRQEQGQRGGISAAQRFYENHGIPVVAAATLDDLIRVLQDFGEPYQDRLRQILEYRGQYGAREVPIDQSRGDYLLPG
jgi:orotate phosphoribosyltransferase